MSIEQKHTVVILESDLDLARSIKLFLEERFHIILVKNPAQLIRNLKKIKFDYLISEVDFPKSKYQKILKKIRQTNPKLKIILMYTFFDDEGLIEKKILSNADDYIFKPFNVEVLKTKLNQLVDKSDSSHQLIKNFQ